MSGVDDMAVCGRSWSWLTIEDAVKDEHPGPLPYPKPPRPKPKPNA